MNEALDVLKDALLDKDWSSATTLIDFVIKNTDDLLTLDEINQLIQYAKLQIENDYPLRWFVKKD